MMIDVQEILRHTWNRLEQKTGLGFSINSKTKTKKLATISLSDMRRIQFLERMKSRQIGIIKNFNHRRMTSFREMAKWAVHRNIQRGLYTFSGWIMKNGMLRYEQSSDHTADISFDFCTPFTSKWNLYLSVSGSWVRYSMLNHQYCDELAIFG